MEPDPHPSAHPYPPLPPDDPAARAARNQWIGRLVVAAALLLLGVWILWDFLPALAWAVVFAIATWPLYRRVTARLPAHGWKALTAPLLFTLLIALVFVVPLAMATVEVGREAHGVLKSVAEVQKTGLPLPEWLGRLPLVGGPAAAWWQTNLSDPDGAGDLLGRIDRATLVGWTRAFGLQLLHRGILFLFMLLTLFFLFRDGAALKRELLIVADRAIGSRGERLAMTVIAAVHGTVNGLVLVGLAEGVVLGIAYAVSGVPHPAILGALTGILAMIPFGAPVVFAAAALLLLGQGSALAAAIVLGIGMTVVFVADHFARPALIGGATRLPFLWVLLGILGGLESFGLLGLFLGPAVMAALISLWREWTEAPRPDGR
jgi:predicted PurR-regulated permease PerM